MAFIDLKNCLSMMKTEGSSKQLKDLQPGEEIEVKVVGKTHSEEQILVAVPGFQADALTAVAQVQSAEIQKGTVITGKVTALKPPFAFIRVNQNSLCVARLHQTEIRDFNALFVGERVKCKVLDMKEEIKNKRRTIFLEVTMRKEHMEAALLDESKLGVQRDQLVKGQKYEGVIVQVNPARSHPIQVSFSN